MIPYNPTDWYWIVGGDETRVYSSAVGNFVLPNNAAYLAFLEAGGAPTRIPSMNDLGDVLADAGVRPEEATILDRYKDRQAGQMVITVPAKVLFNIENRLRVLEGRQQVSAPQFRSVIKEMY